MMLRAEPCGPLGGEARPPGDKSVSHRALMLAALAAGRSRVEGLLEGEDVLATARALRALGVGLARTGEGAWVVDGVGVGGFAEPSAVLDLGNAGTGARLLLGLLAGHGFTSFVTGDDSLRRRPMMRIVEPLTAMGARFLTRSRGRLPLAVTGTPDLLPLEHVSPVASAQVKSAVLLAGLHAPGVTTVVEPARSRDHTERMLRRMGATLREETVEGGHAVGVEGQVELRPADITVPGDPSSAAFPLVAALVTEGSAVTLGGVGVNPLRTGLLTTLVEMGASIREANAATLSGEPVADLAVAGGRLRGVEVPAERAPLMIDEYPILAVAAACAEGTTVMRGLHELRVKESDRLSAIANGLAACGVDTAVEGDSLIVRGRGRPPEGGARIASGHDHRIAMSFLVLGGASRRPVTVEGAETIDTSFPGFADLMNRLGARITPVAGDEP